MLRPSPKNQSCAHFKTLISSDGYRSAVAIQDAQPGSIISREKPFSMVILRSHSREHCANCLAKFDQDQGSPGKRCLGGCQNTYFCSRDCQKEHFTVHKHTCKKYTRIIGGAVQQYNSHFGISEASDADGAEDLFPWENFMLARNVYIKLCLLADIPVNEKRIDFDLPNDIKALSVGPEIHASTPSMQSMHEQTLATVIAHSFGMKSQDAISFFNIMLKKFRINNFGIQNSLQTVIAAGVFPTGAILNHSCDPNCILTYEGSPAMQVIRTIKPVSQGDELFHSYTEVCQPTVVRQSQLMETYSIKCDCERCQGHSQWGEIDDALIEGNDKLSEEDSSSIAKLIRISQQLSIDNVDDGTENLHREYDTLRKALSIQHLKLGRHNLERYKTECLALNTAMVIGDAEMVLPHAEATVDFLGFVYNKYHPLVLLQKMTLSELYDAYGKKERAQKMYKELINACKIAWGDNHEFVYRYKALSS